MNFKTYNSQNAPHRVEKKQNKRLTFSFKSTGLFILGRILHEKMGKPAGILILQDTQYPQDFYLKASKDPQAFQLKAGAHNQMTFQSNTLSGIIAEALHFTPPYRVSFKVKEIENGIFSIGTRQPVIKKKSQKTTI